MKKNAVFISLFVGFCVLIVSCTSTQKTEMNSEIKPEISSEKEILPKHNGILLDAKNAYAIEGVEIFTTNGKGGVFNEDGEIVCSSAYGGQWYGIGWQLRGYDLSKYAGIRFEMEHEVFEDNIHITLTTFTKDEEMNFKFAPNGECYVLFNGVGQAWGNIAEPKPEEGFEINIYAHKNVYPKIKFSSVELIKAEDVGDASKLSIMGKPFGSFTNNALCIGNEITWPKGTTDGKCGWDLTGIDVSEYDRIRIELESSDIVVLPKMIDESWNNWHSFDDCRVGPNTWEFNLTGDDASWKNDGTVDFDKSKGMRIFFQLWTDNKPTEQEYKTTVKSVQLLNGTIQRNYVRFI